MTKVSCASNILILNLILMDPKLCCRYVFPSIRLSKHNFPIQLSPTGPWLEQSQSQGGSSFCRWVRSVTESQRSDPSDWHVGIIPFCAPSLSPEMLSSGLDATLGGSLSLSLSAVTGPNQESAKSGPGRWGGYKFPFNEDFDGFDDDLNYFVKLTKPRWLCWAGAGIM